MGNVSKKVCDIAEGLHNRIENAYNCVPQGIVADGGIGFNVGGREVGHVIDRKDGVDVMFCSPENERYLPVFS